MAKKKFKIDSKRHMVVTPVVRLSFPVLGTPRAHPDDPQQKKFFRCDLIFTKDQLSEAYNGKKVQTVSVKTAIANAKRDMWGPDKSKWPTFNNKTIKVGDEKLNAENEIMEGYEGMFFLTAKTGEKFPPRLFLPNGSEATDRDLYGGCYVRAQIVASAYAMGPNKGVTFYLNQLMKVKDGERFGGLVEDVFDADNDWSEDDDGDDENWDD